MNNQGMAASGSSAMSNNKLQSNAKMPDLRPEAQPKKKIGEKVLRQIPIVKRAFKRSQSFETLNDAALSFTRGLLMGVFKNNNNALDKKIGSIVINSKR